MTAQRWWVRRAARWLARVGGVSDMLRLGMLGLTGVSTATLTLQQYGHGELAWPLIAVLAVGAGAFTYLYTEGGVWNQMSRDQRDLSNNWAGPSQRIQAELIARGIAAAEKGGALAETERTAVTREISAAFTDLRDGVDVVSGASQKKAKEAGDS